MWKTVDGGTDWVPLTDDQETLFMGALALAPSNPNIVYAGTGEAANSELSYYGRGVLKSTDGGSTWSLLPGNAGVDEFDRRTVAQIAVHPSDPDTVYVAVSDNGINGLSGNAGIWKTTDGGTSWTNTTEAAALGYGADVYSDVVIDPSSPDTLYAAIGTATSSGSNGVYKTTDGGDTWNPAGDFPLGTTDVNIGRIRLALAPNLPGTLYASIVNDVDSPAEAGDGSLYKMLKSTDNGDTWNELTGVPNYLLSQGWYDSTLIVSPTNPDEVFAGGAAGANSIIHSSDGGVTWNDLSVGADGKGPHVDHHSIGFNASGILIDGNDGGVSRLDDSTPGSVHWTSLTGDLGVTQFVGIALHPTSPDIAYGASQDNGTNRFKDDLHWTHLADGDGGSVRIDRTNPDTIYHTFDFGPGFIERSDNGGAAWADKTSGIDTAEPANFYAPFIMDPANSSRLLTGTDRVYETTNQADSWTAISAPTTNGWDSTAKVDAIAVAPNNVDTVYASAGGRIFATIDHGATWTERSLPVAGRVGDLIVDPTNSQTVLAVRRVFGGGHVWKSTNGGASWSDLSGDLPDLPVFSIEVDTRPTIDRLYIGTDQGVYASNGISGLWTRFGENLPNVQAADVELNASLNILAAGTHGRGMWQILAAPSADAFEPNALRELAHVLGVIPGVHLRNVSLHQDGAAVDEDWYRVELLHADNLDFTVSFARALADVNLEVTDVDGNLLGSAASGTTNQETVSLGGLNAGTYYVHVTGDGPTHYDLSIDPGAGSLTRVVYVNDDTLEADDWTQAIGDDGNDGLSPLTPKASIRAVLEAYDLESGDLIKVDNGDYNLTANIPIAPDDSGVLIEGFRDDAFPTRRRAPKSRQRESR